MKKRTIIPNDSLIPYGRLNIAKGDKTMSGKKNDDVSEDLKDSVSSKLHQQAISFFLYHPDRWFTRKEIQDALGIGKTQACRLFVALGHVACIEDNEEDKPAPNSPTKLRLSSENIARAQKELYQISSLTNEDRTILTILMDMAESTGLYGDMINKLKEHLSLSRFASKGIIPMVSYSPDMQVAGDGRRFVPEILKAIDQNKSVWITYKAPWSEEPKKYTINPIGIFSQNDILYLFSYNPYFNHSVVHSFSRIKNIKLFEDAETPEKYKDLSLVIDPFGIATDEETITVKVWIDPDQAIFEKEAARSKNAQITENEDGSIIMTVQTRSRYACKKWILSLGNQARCLEPEDLVKEIRSELSESVNQYEHDQIRRKTEKITKEDARRALEEAGNPEHPVSFLMRHFGIDYEDAEAIIDRKTENCWQKKL